mmetsp:Transcript_31234/g.58647  ORF Transcript_31234/g.58647 Transcript_31234/m.58647 type:complete len:305 (-) Transcript_31234:45-959(-)
MFAAWTSLQLPLANHRDAHAVTLAGATFASTIWVEAEVACRLAPCVEEAPLRPFRKVGLSNHVCPCHIWPSTKAASPTGLQSLGGLHTASGAAGHGLERMFAGPVLIRAGISDFPRRAEGNLHPLLMLSRKVAGPQLDFSSVETVIVVDHHTHRRRSILRLNLSDHAVVEPALMLVGFVALPKLNLGSIRIPVTIDDNTVVRELVHPDKPILVYKEVLAAASPLCVALPELYFDTILDPIPVGGQAQGRVSPPCQMAVGLLQQALQTLQASVASSELGVLRTSCDCKRHNQGDALVECHNVFGG